MSAAAPSGWRLLLAPGLATLAALAILVSLGIWQLERKSWKEGLIAAIESRAYGEPADPPPESAWPRWTAAADEFRRLRLSGTFIPGREILVHGLAELRPRQALQGFYVFAPLRLADGSVVILNRGFVPTELRDPASRAAGIPTGPVTAVGLARAPEGRGAFVPANDAARGEWFVRDLRDMAGALGLERVAPFYVDVDSAPNPGGWPRGGQTRLSLPNDHLNYALTWFGLALTLVGVFGAFAWRRLAGGQGVVASATAREP